MRAKASQERHRERDHPHLRSCEAVMGHQVHASDGDIGHVQGYLVEDETWAIRYVVVNTMRCSTSRRENLIASSNKVSTAPVPSPPAARKCRVERSRCSETDPRSIERACDSVGPARAYSLRVNAFPE